MMLTLYGFFCQRDVLGEAQIAANWLSIAIFTPLDDNISPLELFPMSKHCLFEWAGTGIGLPQLVGIKGCFKAYLSPGDPQTR